MSEKKGENQIKASQPVSRRVFLKATGIVVVGAGAGLGIIACGSDERLVQTYSIPAAQGYLLADSKKCQGCLTCMLACSLAHEGEANLSLARIQILQDSFARYPDDLSMELCRQCLDPACVQACPTGALKADASYGYVRKVSSDRCIGCRQCVEACTQKPSRAQVVSHQIHPGGEKSRKCDLCVDTPYHWDPSGGGPAGRQACVAVCPVGALAFTSVLPEQRGDAGYDINMRDSGWAGLGFPSED